MLNGNYLAYTRTSLSNSAPDGVITMELAKGSILNEEMRRKSQGSSLHSNVLVIERQGRSKSRGPSNKGNHRSSSSKGKFGDVECYHCYKKGHTMKFYRQLKKENKKKNYNNQKNKHKKDDDGDFGVVRMGNTGLSRIAGLRRPTGRNLNFIRSENEVEYIGPFDAYCREHGIQHQKTPPKTPQLNGLAERMNITLVERVRCLLSHVGVWSGKDVSYHHLLVFGCKASVHIPKDERSKLDVKNKPCVFLGYGQDTLGYTYVEKTKETIPQHNDDPIDLDPVPPKHFDAQFGDDIQNDEEQNNEEHGADDVDPQEQPNLDEEVHPKLPVPMPPFVSLRRLVVKGFSQKKGINLDEIFSPVVKMGSIRDVIGLAASLDLEVKGKEGYVCRLQKSLYGLKQAPRQWYKKFESVKGNQGFRKTFFDHYVFFQRFGDNDLIILLLYVDDMLIVGKNIGRIAQLKADLSKSFAMKDLGLAKQILGIQIFRDRGAKKLHISQEQYIKKVLRRFNINKAKVVSSPLTPNFKLTDKDCPSSKKNIEKMDRVPYASVVGSLMYAMVCTRPNLAHAVGVVSRFLSNPDLDLARNKDNMKSTSGYLMTFARGGVSWQSRLQKCVALSTTEAEYVAATEACKELLWLKSFLQELCFQANNLWRSL
ncbi:putative RNA-directed DNA polymerase [Tanacetum coccineum]|uniref:RNA-directed DNA polymerase n=1 Tax=Tanacetum coccineum TaxID=301880 RepID=A0ABQ5G639_9ASTR